MKSKVFALLALVSALASTPAVAVPLIPEVRPRVGFGVDPDEFVVGAQALLRARLGGIVRMAPSLDVGFGDNLTTTCANIDLLSATLGAGALGLYGGGGVTFAFFNADGNSDSEIGITLVGGADIGERWRRCDSGPRDDVHESVVAWRPCVEVLAVLAVPSAPKKPVEKSAFSSRVGRILLQGAWL